MYVEHCVILWLSRYIVVRLMKRCTRARAAWMLHTIIWFMLGCAGFRVYCHTGCAHKWKTRLSCVFNTALDLLAAARRIGCGAGGGKIEVMQCKACDNNQWLFEYGFCLRRRRSGMLGVGEEDLTGRYLLE